MGGDSAPQVVIEGIKRARSELGAAIIAVGTEEALGDFSSMSDIECLVATEIITMDEEPAAAVRRKRDSSLVKCAELVRDKRACAMFSAGNTGAAMASALLKMGRISRVSRPAIATPIPVPGSTPTVLLDAGANSECCAAWLNQFAIMGSIYASEKFAIQSPRVGLLSIGEEKAKGNELVKETHDLLAKDARINFVGNVEGRDVMSEDVDVVVTDGFTGNVVLKTLEGGMRTFAKAIFESLSAGDRGEEILGLTLPRLLPLLEILNPETYGGAVLLGVDGLCLIGHGSSSPDAIFNAISTAKSLAEVDLVGRIHDSLAQESTAE